MILNPTEVVQSDEHLGNESRITISEPTLTPEIVRDQIADLFRVPEYIHVLPSYVQNSNGERHAHFTCHWGSASGFGDSPGGTLRVETLEEVFPMAKKMIESDYRYIGTGMRKCDGVEQ